MLKCCSFQPDSWLCMWYWLLCDHSPLAVHCQLFIISHSPLALYRLIVFVAILFLLLLQFIIAQLTVVLGAVYFQFIVVCWAVYHHFIHCHSTSKTFQEAFMELDTVLLIPHYLWVRMVCVSVCERERGRELSLIHIWRCRRNSACRSRWSPYH